LVGLWWVFFFKAKAKVAIGTKNLDAGKNFGFKTHKPAAVRHAGVPGNLKMPATPAIGALFYFSKDFPVKIHPTRRPCKQS
jgi:hypothetical protein